MYNVKSTMFNRGEAREGLQWKARSEATSEDLQRKA